MMAETDSYVSAAMLAAGVRVEGSRICYVRIGNGWAARTAVRSKNMGASAKAGGHGAAEEGARRRDFEDAGGEKK